MSDGMKSTQVTLLCPTCGEKDFEYANGEDMFRCAGCENEISKEDLITHNYELITSHKAKLGRHIEES